MAILLPVRICSLLIRDGLEQFIDISLFSKFERILMTNFLLESVKNTGHFSPIDGIASSYQIQSIPTWLVVSNIWIIFHFISGMSSFPLTNTYFSRWIFNHQPGYYSHLLTIINHHHNHILYNNILTVY